jgi:phosphodiesterase/alkaline phosphatase D-like protein
VGSGTSSQTVSLALTPLAPNTRYFYRVVATNSAGTTRGSILSFTTLAIAVAPSATTGAATGVTTTAATVSGTVNPNGTATVASFEVSTDSTLSNATRSADQSVGSGTSSQTVSLALTPLAPNTRYFYRVVAQNSAGTSRGNIVSFTTTATATPLLAPSDLKASKATNGNRIALTWKDNATNETRYEVYRSTAANVTVSQANRVGGDLPANTEKYTDDTVSKDVTYYYRVRACNTTGCSNLSNEDSEKL